MLLTSVFSSKSQHQPNREHFSPGSLPFLNEDAKQVRWGWEHQVLQGLIRSCNVQEPSVFFASKEALAEKGVSQVANNVTYGKKMLITSPDWELYQEFKELFRRGEKKSILNSLCFLKHSCLLIIQETMICCTRELRLPPVQKCVICYGVTAVD